MKTTTETKAAVLSYMKIRDASQNRPFGTYEAAQDIYDLIESVMDFYEREARALGLKQYKDHDRALNMAAMIYGTLADANPLAVAHLEGFGEHSHKSEIVARAALVLAQQNPVAEGGS